MREPTVGHAASHRCYVARLYRVAVSVLGDFSAIRHSGARAPRSVRRSAGFGPAICNCSHRNPRSPGQADACFGRGCNRRLTDPYWKHAARLFPASSGLAACAAAFPPLLERRGEVLAHQLWREYVAISHPASRCFSGEHLPGSACGGSLLSGVRRCGAAHAFAAASEQFVRPADRRRADSGCKKARGAALVVSGVCFHSGSGGRARAHSPLLHTVLLRRAVRSVCDAVSPFAPGHLCVGRFFDPDRISIGRWPRGHQCRGGRRGPGAESSSQSRFNSSLWNFRGGGSFFGGLLRASAPARTGRRAPDESKAAGDANLGAPSCFRRLCKTSLPWRALMVSAFWTATAILPLWSWAGRRTFVRWLKLVCAAQGGYGLRK